MDNEDFSVPVVSDWSEMKECMFAEKCWVNPKNVDVSKEYELGDFLRVWCLHDECWCSASLGVECCAIYLDHMNE